MIILSLIMGLPCAALAGFYTTMILLAICVPIASWITGKPQDVFGDAFMDYGTPSLFILPFTRRGMWLWAVVSGLVYAWGIIDNLPKP